MMMQLLSTVQSAERGVTFSGYVTRNAGDLSFGPLQAYAEGFGETAGLRLVAGNSGDAKAQVHFQAFDGHFNQVRNVQLPPATELYPGETRTFFAVVPIMQDVANRYRICAVMTSTSVKQKRLCGKYIARKH